MVSSNTNEQLARIIGRVSVTEMLSDYQAVEKLKQMTSMKSLKPDRGSGVIILTKDAYNCQNESNTDEQRLV